MVMRGSRKKIHIIKYSPDRHWQSKFSLAHQGKLFGSGTWCLITHSKHSKLVLLLNLEVCKSLDNYANKRSEIKKIKWIFICLQFNCTCTLLCTYVNETQNFQILIHLNIVLLHDSVNINCLIASTCIFLVLSSVTVCGTSLLQLAVTVSI